MSDRFIVCASNQNATAHIESLDQLNKEIETHIEEFESDQVIHLREKFVACTSWYMVWL